MMFSAYFNFSKIHIIEKRLTTYWVVEHCAECFTCTRLFNPQSNPIGFYRWGNRLRVKQLISGYTVSGGAGNTNRFWTRKEKNIFLKKRCLLWTLPCKAKQLKKRQKSTWEKTCDRCERAICKMASVGKLSKVKQYIKFTFEHLTVSWKTTRLSI